MDEISIWTVGGFGQVWPFGRYVSDSRELLAALARTHQKFSQLAAVGSNEPMQVLLDPAQLDETIRLQAFDDDHLQDYIYLNANNKLDRQSLSRIGFSVTYCSVSADLTTILPPTSGGIDLTVTSGSASGDQTSSIVLKLPADCTSDIHEPGIVRDLLRVLLEKWDSRFGGVSVKRYQQKIRGNDRSSYGGEWLLYLPFPNLGRCLANDLSWEVFGEGVLISTTPHAPDADSSLDIAAGLRVRTALDDLGLIWNSTFAITGWPPDREETIYEQFISGAPANRKYTVHCINFDGYDSDRKVLLYAKLFRRLKRHPKEWGLRGWDGPVLNEAKRQVRAAAKAGGVPIEWHVGLEEPAHQVRQLLVDHTDITEQQLRVIYTPLEEALNRAPPP